MNPIVWIGILIMGAGLLMTIFFLFVLLYKKIFDPKSLLSPQKRFFNENQLKFVEEIERMHADNEGKFLMTGDKEIFENVTGQSANGEKNYEKLLGIEGWEDADEKSDLYICGNYVRDLMGDLNRRIVYANYPFELKSADEVMKEYSLNIKDNEKLVYKVSNVVDLFEEKTRVKSISYSGISTTFRSGSLKFKTGTLTPIPNREDYWSLLDRGSLFLLTNKIIFAGQEKRKNKVISYDDILTGDFFSNGIVLSLANSKKILIDFPEFKDKLVKRDDRNIFVIVLQRILEKSTEIDLSKNN